MIGVWQEIAKKDVEREQLLRIDMDWGIRRPPTVEEATGEVNAPAQVRRICRDLQDALLRYWRGSKEESSEDRYRYIYF